MSTINPFDSLGIKIWLNYSLIYVVLILVLITIYVKIKGKLNVTQLLLTIYYPSDSYWIQMLEFGVMLPCLISFTFWTFNELYGVDLASTLVGMKFRDGHMGTFTDNF